MRVALLLAVSLLAGCQGDAEPEPAPGLSNTTTTGDERTRIVPRRGDAVTLRTGARVPVTLPSGFAIYPGAKVVSNTVVERGGARRVLLVFETPDPLAKVMTFHRGQAEAAGAVLTLDLGGPEQASIGGRLPSGGELTISARQRSAGTRVEMSAS